MTMTQMFVVAAIILTISGVIYLLLLLRFERWKSRHTAGIRRDAVQRSSAVTLGKVYEQVVPLLPHFRWNPRDARFLGAPVDFVVFDGLDEGSLRRVIFVEVKTGTAAVTPRERMVRDAIRRGEVEWFELRLPQSGLETPIRH